MKWIAIGFLVASAFYAIRRAWRAISRAMKDGVR
jgi:hypothetical protein